MIIKIDDMTNEVFEMEDEQEVLDLSPWLVLNMREIAASIAYALFDSEYDIKEEDIDEEINDYLSHIHRCIRDDAIDILKDNGRVVL